MAKTTNLKKAPKGKFVRKTIKKSAHPSNTKNLVLQTKRLFKMVANEVLDFPEALMEKLLKKTNIDIFRECLLFGPFRDAMMEKVESNQLLAMYIHGRMEHKNLGNVYLYYNRLINGVYNPQEMTSGYWTRKTILIGVDCEGPKVTLSITLDDDDSEVSSEFIPQTNALSEEEYIGEEGNNNLLQKEDFEDLIGTMEEHMLLGGM